MFVLKFTMGLLTLVSSAWVEELTEFEENVVEEDTSGELSVGELLTRANRDLSPDEPTLMGDIAMHSEKNADPCTATGCMWQKYSDGNIWVPYVIANHFSSREVAIIQRGLDSFAETTCIRFFQRQNERDYLSIESRSGCYSYVGRQGCLYHSTVQHELLHALGFNHEQTRSDRDNHIHVYWENIIDGTPSPRTTTPPWSPSPTATCLSARPLR
ncbi:high choriolytic enzyme 1-like [Salmo salar]|uniref:Metalloendopeptidase n=1 Tax=Salmo salar TaxID=8030 RepID=A0A1S3PRC2_SALSA|nr:high choriolytic enzyme 1-like [Salmo salar]